MFSALAQALGAGLSLWNTKEQRRYVDQLIAIQKEYRAEDNKDPALRSDAVLDDCEFRLRLLAIAFASEAGKPNPAIKP